MPGGVGGVVGRWLQVHMSILHQHAGNREVLVRVVSSLSVVESGQVSVAAALEPELAESRAGS
jgi:hypothetical protein